MARNGSGVYSLPGTYTAVSGETIEAQQHNDPLEDLQTDANTARPIVAGGTGAVTAAAARTALSVPGLSADNTFSGANTFSGNVVGIIPTGVVLPFAGYTAPTGFLLIGSSAVSRTTYATLFGALTATATATKDGTTAVLTSVDTDFTSNGFVGAYVEGTGIATGTTIVSLTSTTITLSAIPSTAASITIRILPHGQGDGSTTFDLPQVPGRVIAGREATASRLTTAVSGVNGAQLGAAGGDQNPATHTHGAGSYVTGTVVTGVSSATTQDGTGVNRLISATTGQSSITGTSGSAGSGSSGNVQPTIVLNHIIKT